MIKRILLLLILLGLLVLPENRAAAGPVSQKVDNPHGKFVNNTGMCGNCHNSIHRAAAPRLLSEAVIREFCYTCHGGAALGSDYNVELGRKTGVAADFLSGGLFSGEAESEHLLQQTNYPYGSTKSGGAKGDSILLTCVSCHDPHGTENFRNLRVVVNGVAVGQGTVAADISSIPTATVYGQAAETIIYRKGIVSFCSACHTQYAVGSSPDPDLGNLRFRHPVNVTAWANPGNVGTSPAPFSLEWPAGQVPGVDQTGRVVCLTCHFAHGSKVRNIEQIRVTPGGATDGSNKIFTLPKPIADNNYDALVNTADVDLYIDNNLQPGNSFNLTSDSGIETVTPPSAGVQLSVAYAAYMASTAGADTPLAGNELLRLPNLAICNKCHNK